MKRTFHGERSPGSHITTGQLAYYAAEGGKPGLAFEAVRLEAAGGNQFGVEHQRGGKMQLGQTRAVAGRRAHCEAVHKGGSGPGGQRNWPKPAKPKGNVRIVQRLLLNDVEAWDGGGPRLGSERVLPRYPYHGPSMAGRSCSWYAPLPVKDTTDSSISNRASCIRSLVTCSAKRPTGWCAAFSWCSLHQHLSHLRVCCAG